VKQYLATLQQGATDRTAVDMDSIGRELAAVGFANLLDYLDIHGNIDINKLSREAGAAISELVVTGQGDAAKVRIKLHSKLDALDKLTKIVGGYGADNSQKQPENGPVNVRKLARELAFLLSEADRSGRPAPVTLDGELSAVSSNEAVSDSQA